VLSQHSRGDPAASMLPARMIEETDTAILELLASSPGYLSGQMIARKLKLSRTAVWKRITKLREVGCRIPSGRNRGYRLVSTPDKLLPPFIKVGLNTSRIAREIYYYPQVDSTNLKAKSIATQGVSDGTLVLTEHQTQGQGRLDRTWVSPPGKNLLFSLAFYPSVPPTKAFQLTLLASLSVCKSLIAVSKIKAGIKWPNDIYVNNRKVCGILTEFSASTDRINWAVVGIGVNVNYDPSSDTELATIATSIKKERGRSQRRIDLLRSILEEMDRLYSRFLEGNMHSVREEWLGHSIILGKPVVITADNYREEGIAETIDENGALILRTGDGERKRIIYGDLSLRIKSCHDHQKLET
jgi:BirA family biotin operon repressor/biotin-[acetyl-CoA-carboxylase] ligase